jgi:lipopolysaccharide export system protein LptC
LLLAGLMAAAAVALAGGFVIQRCVLEKPEVLLTVLDDKAQLALQKIHQTATRGGITEWSLEADSARYLDDSKELLLENLAVEFFMDDGARMLLTANRGTLRTDTNDIAVRENVHVTKADLALATEALDYDHQKRILTSQTEVRITSGNSQITAKTFRYDLNTRQAFLDGDVRGVFSENDGL